MSTILLNDNIFSHTAQRGVARYFQKVAEGVAAHFGEQATLFSPEPPPARPARHLRAVRVRRNQRQLVHDLLASLVALHERPALMFSAYFGNARTRAPEAFTVYDMIYERFPAYFSPDAPPNRRFIVEKRRCAERATLLFAISQATADDVLDLYPHLDPAKLVVTHLGVDDFFFAAPPAPPSGGEKPFFLYVGNRTLYKNFPRLLHAFGQSGLAPAFDLRVLSPAGSPLSREEQALIARYHLQASVHLHAGADDATLRDHYTRAVAFLYPSEYEGFGLPILEAMASGTLVGTSHAASMPEVGGEAALYFDPYQPDSIADCLLRLTALSTEERGARVARGIAHARTFTWQRCQQQTVTALCQVIQRRG